MQNTDVMWHHGEQAMKIHAYTLCFLLVKKERKIGGSHADGFYWQQRSDTTRLATVEAALELRREKHVASD